MTDMSHAQRRSAIAAPPRGRALPDRRRPVHRRRRAAAARRTACSCARRTRTRASASIDTARREGGARRRRDLHRRRPGRGEGRRAAVRLADPQQGRHADEGAAAPGARAGQGAPRRRPGRAGRRRDAAAGEGRGRADRGRLRGAAGGDRHREAPRAPARAVHDDVPDNVCYDWGHGDKAAVDAAFAKAAQRDEARLRQQPADPERDRAARGERDLHRGTTTATRCTSPTRTRTSSGC